MQHTVRRRPRSISVAVASSLAASVATVLTGCTPADDLLPPMSVPAPSTVPSQAEAQGGPPQPPPAGATQNAFTVTGQQQVYLDALHAAGVKPSTDLLALSIGSYVCQARAAKQSDQAVRDYVTPRVRDDVRKAQPNAVAPPPAQVDAVIDDYIRIATERLC